MSDAVTKYVAVAGPRPDPCITLALILSYVDNSFEYFVHFVRPSKKCLIQLKILKNPVQRLGHV